MTLDQVITAFIYIITVFFIIFIARLVYAKLHPKYLMKEELVEKDNFALALAIVGYYFGLILAIGGILVGPSAGLREDIMDILIYGVVAIILLSVSIFINHKVIMYKFDNEKEIIQDRNAGTGIVEAANHIAVGLIIYGAISGEGGSVLTAAGFWILGQAVLILSVRVYDFIVPYDLHEQIEKDNVAVGVAFAGVLIAIGNIVRLGISGDFISWSDNLSQFIIFVIFGLIMLPVIRFFTDKILLPGGRLTKELVGQEKPNVGAAAIEAFSYIGASFLIGWVI